MRILFTGGGTGGHVFPIIAVVRQLKKVGQLEMYFLGAAAGAGFSDVLQKEGIKTKTILTGKLRRYFSINTILDFIKMPIGLIQSFLYLYIWMPDVIFNKGGFGSVPVVLVGWLYRIPILTHESDSVPGLANRLGAKFSKKIAISFDKAKKYFPEEKTALVGSPIRSQITQICLSTDPSIKEKARNTLGLVSQKPVILILGGSQGAQILNQAVLGILPQLLEKYEVVHQCGANNLDGIKGKIGQIPLANYHLFSFLDENQIAFAYLSSDLIVSRAGNGSISEIAICGKPSILIPLLGSASDHQKENAFAYAQAGGAVVLEQDNLTPNLFINEIDKIFNNPELKQKMATNAKVFSKASAAEKIAGELIEMGN